MPHQHGAQATQLGLEGQEPAETWLSMQQALDAFKNAGAEEVRLMALAHNDTIRTRLSDHGYEFHPLDVERWAKIEGAIADGQTQQLLNRRRTDHR